MSHYLGNQRRPSPSIIRGMFAFKLWRYDTVAATFKEVTRSILIKQHNDLTNYLSK